LRGGDLKHFLEGRFLTQVGKGVTDFSSHSFWGRILRTEGQEPREGRQLQGKIMGSKYSKCVRERRHSIMWGKRGTISPM